MVHIHSLFSNICMYTPLDYVNALSASISDNKQSLFKDLIKVSLGFAHL